MKERSAARNNIILSMLIFGSVGIFRRYIELPSASVALFRSIIGLLSLLLFSFIRRQRPDMSAIKRNLPVLCLSGVVLGMNWVTLFEAYNYTSVAAATMCYYMAPVIITLVSFFGGEKLSRRKWICTLFVFVGMLLVSGVLESGLHGAKGLAFGLLGAMMYAAVVLLNKRMDGISGGDRTVVQLAVAGLALLVYVLIKGELAGAAPGGMSLAMLLILGVAHTGLAYKLYFGSIPNVPAQTAALLSYIDPVVAVLLSVFLLRESMSAAALIGCAVVIVSLMLSESEK